MGARRQGREFALQSLYLTDVSNITPEKALAGVLHGQEVDEKIQAFARRLTLGTIENRPALDDLIKKYARNWELERMAALDRNILRLGAFEMLHELDTPISVIIDEAVEIAKTYSTDDSGKFVNGILDKIKTERRSSNGTPPPEKS